jgi:hypothetical protein
MQDLNSPYFDEYSSALYGHLTDEFLNNYYSYCLVAHFYSTANEILYELQRRGYSYGNLGTS